MWRLKVCLWVVAAACIISGLTLFLPLSTYNSIAASLASTKVPQDPRFVYALRTLCATYLGVGLFFVLLALHPRRYDIMVPFSGTAAVFVGIVCGVVGIIEGLPAGWVIGDAAFGIVFGGLIVHLWRASHAGEQGNAAAGGTERQTSSEAGREKSD